MWWEGQFPQSDVDTSAAGQVTRGLLANGARKLDSSAMANRIIAFSGVGVCTPSHTVACALIGPRVCFEADTPKHAYLGLQATCVEK